MTATTKHAALALASGLMASSAGAATIYTDTFSYTGPLTSNGYVAQTTGAGTNAISANGSVASLTTSGEDVFADFTGQISTGSAYYGATINLSAAQTAGDYFLHFSTQGSISAFYGRLFAKSSGTGYVLGTQVVSAGVVYGTTVLPFNTDVRAVVRYDFVTGGTGNDQSVLYVNPTSPVESSNAIEVTAVQTAGATNDAGNVGQINFRQGSGTAAPTLTVDNLIVSDDFANSAAVVPEPASLALLGLSSLAMLRRRRA